MTHANSFEATRRASARDLRLGRALARLGARRLQRAANTAAHERILSYLSDILGDVIAQHASAQPPRVDSLTPQLRPIAWTCWWQGSMNAPPVVQLCLERLGYMAGEFDVRSVSAATYADAVEIDGRTIDLLNRGTITRTHFSDILRAHLMRQHGGIWIDATVWVARPLQESLVSNGFFSRKSDFDNFMENVSGRRWSSFLLGGTRDLPVWHFLCDFLTAYWERHDAMVSYFLIDYAMAIAYRNNIGGLRGLIDAMPSSNPSLYALADVMGSPADAHFVERMRTDPTQFYKMSWRDSPPLEVKYAPTVFGTLVAASEVLL